MATVLLWSCQQAPVKGTLEVRVKDHRQAIDDFTNVGLTLDALRIKPKGLNSWRDLTLATTQVDLTELVGGGSAVIHRSEMEARSFEALDLDIKKINETLKDTKKKAKVQNSLGPIWLPFSISENKMTRIVLDLTIIDISDHPPRGYELHIKGYELYTDGQLTDKIPPG
ncbi:MAG: DUF4382 domain-containing protein [Candidatus Binatia bacterium]|nr:DUF4382 domain-containing protein [Candidatus Binatia bacterium]